MGEMIWTGKKKEEKGRKRKGRNERKKNRRKITTGKKDEER